MERRLGKKANAALSLSNEERIRRVYTQRWIDYKAALDVFARLEHLMSHPPTHRVPGLLIISQTNNGKTALVNEFCRRHAPSFEREGEADLVPVVLIEAPPIPSEDRLLATLADQLRVPYKRKEQPHFMVRRLQNVIPKLGVRIIVIDEIHNAEAGMPRQQRAFLNVIKYLINELKIPFVGVGTQLALSAISTDPQLTNRLEPAVLPRWQYDREFVRLLMSFEQVLPLREESKLAEPEIANRLFGLSEGSIGELSSLINRAAAEAIRNGEERITPALLDKLDWIAPSRRREVASAIV